MSIVDVCAPEGIAVSGAVQVSCMNGKLLPVRANLGCVMIKITVGLPIFSLCRGEFTRVQHKVPDWHIN